MRKQDTLELEQEGAEPITITVRELTVKQVLSTFDRWKEAKQEEGFTGLLEDVRGLFDLSISGIQFNELEELAPSEIKQIYEKFKEVNSVFFDLADSMGFKDILKELADGIKKDFSKLFAGSLSEVI